MLYNDQSTKYSPSVSSGYDLWTQSPRDFCGNCPWVARGFLPWSIPRRGPESVWLYRQPWELHRCHRQVASIYLVVIHWWGFGGGRRGCRPTLEQKQSTGGLLQTRTPGDTSSPKLGCGPSPVVLDHGSKHSWVEEPRNCVSVSVSLVRCPAAKRMASRLSRSPEGIVLFAVGAPKWWTVSPRRQASALSVFKSLLKSHLFFYGLWHFVRCCMRTEPWSTVLF